MTLIEIEQDDPKLLDRLRGKIAEAAKVIGESYSKDELRGVRERTFEVATFNGYLAGLYEHKLLSDQMLVELNAEWEAARAAASRDPLARVMLSD